MVNAGMAMLLPVAFLQQHFARMAGPSDEELLRAQEPLLLSQREVGYETYLLLFTFLIPFTQPQGVTVMLPVRKTTSQHGWMMVLDLLVGIWLWGEWRGGEEAILLDLRSLWLSCRLCESAGVPSARYGCA
jgi:hypothetical protein